MARWKLAVVGICALFAWQGCLQDEAADSGPLVPTVVVDPPSEACACDSPSTYPDPFSDIRETRVVISRVPPRDPTRSAEELQPQVVYTRNTVAGRDQTRLPAVPAGGSYTLELFANGQQRSWYGRTTGLMVPKNSEATTELMVTAFGGLVPIHHPAIANPLFAAGVSLGDGRVFVSGGFTGHIGGKDSPALGPATDAWFIFDATTGSIVSHGTTPTARGAHAVAFLQATNQVLVVGGATRLPLAVDQPFPFAWPDDAGVAGCELFDLPSAEHPNGRWHTGAGLELRLPRVFPRVAVLADGTVAVTGGGPWPEGDEADYRRLELFYPESSELRADCQGAADIDPPCFATIHAFDSWAPRAGHTLTFLEKGGGLSRFLVWGGTPEGLPLAELLRQSGRQSEGADGNFEPLEVRTDGAPRPHTWFHEVAPLAGQRFLVTGGVRAVDGQLQAPLADEAWLLEYHPGTDGTPYLTAEHLPGGLAPRFFHSALSDDLLRVVVAGGFGTEARNVELFDLASRSWSVAPEASGFAPRGGHLGVGTPTGSMLLVGGRSDATLAPPSGCCARIELYTPSSIPWR